MKMKQTPLSLHPRFKLWLSTDRAEGVFGDGKWRLLEAIDDKGSLKKAAESLGISYRKAWGDFKKAESCLGTRFIEKIRGGKDGGKTVLTAEGRNWIHAYSQYRLDMEKNAEKSFNQFIAAVNHEKISSQ